MWINANDLSKLLNVNSHLVFMLMSVLLLIQEDFKSLKKIRFKYKCILV